MTYPIKADKLRVTSYYGNRTYKYQGKKVSDFHSGIDLVANPSNSNAEIVAFADGVVTGVRKTGEQYGNGCYVRVKHSNGWQTLYYHLKSNSIVVNVGDNVKEGQKLGIIGTTGISTGIHLHFQIDKGSSSTSVNPYDYLFNGKEFLPSQSGIDLTKYTDSELADMVIAGKFGNGAERRTKLGDRYSSVQKLVNEKLNGGAKKEDTQKQEDTKTSNEINLGDTVIVNGHGCASSTGSGSKTRTYTNTEMKVIMISGNVNRPNRYALNQYNKGNINDATAVTGWFSINDIKKK